MVEIQKFIHEDVDFEAAIKMTIHGGEQRNLYKILALSPDEFDQLALDQLSPPLKVLISKIRALALLECRVDSPFATACIKQAKEYLEAQENATKEEK